MKKHALQFPSYWTLSPSGRCAWASTAAPPGLKIHSTSLQTRSPCLPENISSNRRRKLASIARSAH